MSKIMLVEDDNSLREIYSIRLTAEGYVIVSAGDGEEALAMAVKERPDLISSDVMMPKISGFDMLDILRSTPETKDIKVIMMTALSSEDQRERGEHLGADRYLVKSQVGIEDVVNVVHEVLGDRASDGTIQTNVEAGANPGTTAQGTTTMPGVTTQGTTAMPGVTTQGTTAMPGVTTQGTTAMPGVTSTPSATPAPVGGAAANGVGAVTAEPANEGIALTIPREPGAVAQPEASAAQAAQAAQPGISAPQV